MFSQEVLSIWEDLQMCKDLPSAQTGKTCIDVCEFCGSRNYSKPRLFLEAKESIINVKKVITCKPDVSTCWNRSRLCFGQVLILYLNMDIPE